MLLPPTLVSTVLSLPFVYSHPRGKDGQDGSLS